MSGSEEKENDRLKENVLSITREYGIRKSVENIISRLKQEGTELSTKIEDNMVLLALMKVDKSTSEIEQINLESQIIYMKKYLEVLEIRIDYYRRGLK